MYCRDVSALMSSVKLGPVCESGAVLATFPIDSKVFNCREMRLCGKTATKVTTVAEQFDGTPVQIFEFADLPWGCDAKIEISTDSSFATIESILRTSVVPPTCQFCERTQTTTCATCSPLGENEQLVKGVVIPKTCSGGCKACNLDTGDTLPHGGSWNFYSRQAPVCGQPCSQISQLKVCNDGVWSGDTKFAFSQCSDIKDPSCTCTHPITKASILSNSPPFTLYKPISDCGKTCDDPTQSLSVICESGALVDTNLNPISSGQFSTFNSLTCSNSTCASASNLSSTNTAPVTAPETSFTSKVLSYISNMATITSGGASCNAGGTTVADGDFYTFYSSNSGSCTNKCSTKTLSRQCLNGAFAGDSSYSYSSCVDVPCGCYLPNNGQTYDSGPTVITIYKTASPSCGQSCTGGGQSLEILCQNGTWVDNTLTPVPQSAFSTYPAAQCTAPKCDCQRLGRLTIPDDGQFHDVYSANAPACPSKCSEKKGSVKCTGGVLTGDTSFAYDIGQCTDPVCACTVPLDGGSSASLGVGAQLAVYRYKENTTTNPALCEAADAKITLTCTTQKTLSPSYNNTVYKYDSCKVNDFSCKVGNFSITYGSSATFAKTNSPACGEVCETKKVFCTTTGTLVLDSDKTTPVDPATLAQSYPNINSCTPKDCSCNVNGYVIPYKGTKDFYSAWQGPSCDPTSCDGVKATLTCGDNKVVTGGDPATFQYTRCEAKSCTCALPSGGSILNGTGFKVYAVDHASCDNRTACEDNSFQLYCSSGAITPANYDPKYQYSSCTPALCSCNANGVQIDFGNDVYFYKTATPPAETSCGSVAAKFKCYPGGEVVGYQNENLNDYKEIACLSATDQGDLGGTGGGTGNDEGPGSAIRNRKGLGDGGGSSLPCIEGVTCTASENQYVVLPTHNRAACRLPWGMGEVEFFGSLVAFDRSCVASPGRCSDHRQIRTCNFLGWTGSPSFNVPSCQEKPSCP